jgi:CubicO group peptidase (beta-lactamase class C family)
MKKYLLSILCGLLFCSLSFAQLPDKAKLDEYFNVLEKNNKFMGSVAVSKNGTILYQRSVGLSDVEGNKRANEQSTYRIGSISKTFTAVLVMRAVEQQLIQLDQTIEGFFPTIKNANKITIRHLLSHRSGIHNFTDDKDFLTWNTQPQSEKAMMERLSQLGSDFQPDYKFSYSNSNYVLLTFLLEKVMKDKYPSLLKKFILQPIGLKNTFYGGKINVSKNESKSYTYRDGWKAESETDMSIPLGAGAIVSNPADIILFSEALFNGKIIQPESLVIMTNMKDNYGLGLFVIPFYDKKGYGHTGGIDGFNAVFSYFPEDKVAYALTSNGTNFINNKISIALLSAVFGRPFDIPVFKIFELSIQELDLYVGTYSTPNFPLKITISREGNSLMAQATGQPAFPLSPIAQHKFQYEQAGVSMEFDPEKKTLQMKQAGRTINFTKE